MNKKGEKSLQMIFGLFILLIISLVVLSLFFKFTEKSTSQMSTASTEYFSKAAIEKAIQECQSACEQIQDINGVIEFCRAYKRIDFDGDNALVSKASRGKWDFCESKVPCFVLVDNCKNGLYTGFKCKAVLLNQRPDGYLELNGSNSGGCGLSNNCANWINYFQWWNQSNFDTPGMDCPKI